MQQKRRVTLLNELLETFQGFLNISVKIFKFSAAMNWPWYLSFVISSSRRAIRTAASWANDSGPPRAGMFVPLASAVGAHVVGLLNR